jgi:hypothetical protein
MRREPWLRPTKTVEPRACSWGRENKLRLPPPDTGHSDNEDLYSTCALTAAPESGSRPLVPKKTSCVSSLPASPTEKEASPASRMNASSREVNARANALCVGGRPASTRSTLFLATGTGSTPTATAERDRCAESQAQRLFKLSCSDSDLHRRPVHVNDG